MPSLYSYCGTSLRHSFSWGQIRGVDGTGKVTAVMGGRLPSVLRKRMKKHGKRGAWQAGPEAARRVRSAAKARFSENSWIISRLKTGISEGCRLLTQFLSRTNSSSFQ